MSLAPDDRPLESPHTDHDLNRKKINMAILQIQSSGWSMEAINKAIALLSAEVDNLQNISVESLVGQVTAQVAEAIPLSASGIAWADNSYAGNDGGSDRSNGGNEYSEAGTPSTTTPLSFFEPKTQAAWTNWVNAGPTFAIKDSSNTYTNYKRSAIFVAMQAAHNAFPNDPSAGKEMAAAEIAGSQLRTKFVGDIGHGKKNLGYKSEQQASDTLNQLQGFNVDKIKIALSDPNYKESSAYKSAVRLRACGASERLRESGEETIAHMDATAAHFGEHQAAEHQMMKGASEAIRDGAVRRLNDITFEAAANIAGAKVDDPDENRKAKDTYNEIVKSVHEGIVTEHYDQVPKPEQVPLKVAFQIPANPTAPRTAPAAITVAIAPKARAELMQTGH